jgi:hypothetical protein
MDRPTAAADTPAMKALKRRRGRARRLVWHRVALDLVPLAMARLDALKAKTQAPSYVAVVRHALCIYEMLIEEVESGKQLQIRDENGVVSPLRLFL